MPVAAQETPIDAVNAARLREVARLGRGLVHGARFSHDKERIFVAGSLGIWQYARGALDTIPDPQRWPSVSADLMSVRQDDGAVVIGSGSTVQVWADGALQGEIDTGRRLAALAVNASDGWLVTAHSDDSLRLWRDPQADSITLGAGEDSLKTLALHPHGRLLASGGALDSLLLWRLPDPASTATLASATFVDVAEASLTQAERDEPEDATESKLEIIVEIHAAPGEQITSLAFSADGKSLASGDAGGGIRIRDGESGALQEIFGGTTHRKTVTALAFDPMGETLASGGRDGEVRLWTVATGEQRTISRGDDADAWIQPERGAITSLQFSADGGSLLVSAAEQFVGIYDVATRRLLASARGHTDAIVAIATSPYGEQLSMIDDLGDMWLWRVGDDKPFASVPRFRELANGRLSQPQLAYAPDGSYIAVNGTREISLIKAGSGELLRTIKLNGSAYALAISPDSELVAVAGSRDLSLFEVDGGLRVAEIPAERARFNAVAFHPRQTLLYAASADGAARVYGLDG